MDARKVIETCARRAARQIGRFNYVTTTAEFQEYITGEFAWVEGLVDALEKIRDTGMGSDKDSDARLFATYAAEALTAIPREEGGRQ